MTTDTWLIRVYNEQTLVVFKECAGPVELGREDKKRPEERLYELATLDDGGYRLPIAPCEDVKMSRRHALLESVSGARLLVRNLSENSSIGFDDRSQLKPGSERIAELPVVLRVGSRVVRVQMASTDDAERMVKSLEEPTAAPGEETGCFRRPNLGLEAEGPVDPKGVFAWLGAMTRVLQSAACDADFFHKTAQAVVEVVGLDMGRVLTRNGDGWRTEVFYPTEDHEYEKQNPPSRMVLNRVLKESKVSWFDLYDLDQDCASLAGISSVVAAPVRARSGEVIAILYGERRLRSLVASNKPLNQLDAMLTEVLAVGLAAGLARVSQERAALALQTQFEQFFTPELARVLAAQPKLLDGKDLEITVLFGDIRGFSRITSDHPPAFTLEWTHDVLSVLSECVLKHNGVLVDYIGDEIVAMWGAPDEQPDHAEQACLAALDMLSSLDELNERWAEKLGEPMGLGIGINTGIARVGNTGSSRKFKYGPLGSTVNVASRVQGASKYFKSSLLITRATRNRLGSSFQFRRVGTARVINITDPIELFELWLPNQPHCETICTTYEEALEAFECRDFRRATGILGRLVYNHHDDGPSFALLARAIACFVDEPENFDPAFRLPGK